MTKRGTLLGAAVLAAALRSRRWAEARMIDLRLAANGGVMLGWGTTSKTPDFFRQSAAPASASSAGSSCWCSTSP